MQHHLTDRPSAALLGLFCLDRLLKLAAVRHFFRRPAPPPPARWPSVTLLQPITRGVDDLAGNLASRMALDYPAPVQHLLICDERDQASQAACRALAARHPRADVRLVLAAPDQGALASKIGKLRAALPLARGEVLCFVDDDVALRPTALRTLLPYLGQPGAGAVFGLACYTNWRGPWSALMSGFVNANALLSYIPLTYLAEPYTITGHCFALHRDVFAAVGGLEGMAARIDDDHELARRLRRHGLRSVQTPMVYDVDNHLPSLPAYLAQMQRWFVMPRILMLPALSRAERAATAVGSLGGLLPPLLAAVALLTRGRRAGGALLAALGVFAAAYLHGERRYLRRATPARGLALLPLVALAAPLQILWGLLAGNHISWRGQRLRIGRDGTVEVIE